MIGNEPVERSVGLVLAVTPGYSETFLRSKICGLQEQGIDVRIFVGRGNREANVFSALPIDRRRKVKTALVSMWAWGTLLVVRPHRVIKFARCERELQRDWVSILQGLAIYHHILMNARSGWIHFGFAALAVNAESLALAVGAKMGVSLRGHDVATYPLMNPGCYRHVWARVNKVHTISDDLVFLARSCGLPESVQIEKISPAIDSDFFRRPASDYRDANVEWRLLTVARLHWKKGLEYVMLALKELSARQPDLSWKYTIAGDGVLLERLKFSASEMGLGDRVVIAGKLAPEEIKKAYLQADVYLQYSVQEGFCNAVLEAQAMELPCIVSDAEGLPENAGTFGVVVPKRRPDLLVIELEKMFATPAREYHKNGEMARQRVISQFDLSRQSVAFRRFFEFDEQDGEC